MTATATELPAVARHLDLHVGEINFYNEEGYLVVPDFIKPDHISAIRDEVYAVLEANGVPRSSLGKASSAADKLRQCSQYLAGSGLDALINGEATRHLASQLIGGEARVYLPFTAVKAAGGGGEFHFHQDNNYTNHEPALGSINVWVALVDMTPENGCLCVVPHSHKKGKLQAVLSGDGDAHKRIDVDATDYLPVRMRAGDAIAFTRLTVHGSGPNHTDEPRAAYALQYHRPDVNFFDPDDEQWKPLVDTPRFAVGPVTKLGPQ